MTGPDTSILGGILAAGTLLLANALIGYAQTKVPILHQAVVGQPTVLIRDGQVLADNLTHEEIPEDELMGALREHGAERADTVALATLEVDGSISVVPQETGHLRGWRRAVRFIRAAR